MSCSKTAEGWTLDRSFGVAVPVTFAETVRRRIAAVPGIRELLGAAALLGRSFDWRLLPDMIKGADEAGVVTHLRRAAEAQLLSVESGDGGFRFRHALTREAILAELLPPERVLLASSGLRAVEQAHPGLPGEWCELAAELAEAAGQPAQAADLHLESGRRAYGRGALASAEAALERARHLVDDDDRRRAVDIDEMLCEVLVATGNAATGERGRPAVAVQSRRRGHPARPASTGASAAGSSRGRVRRLAPGPRSAPPRRGAGRIR